MTAQIIQFPRAFRSHAPRAVDHLRQIDELHPEWSEARRAEWARYMDSLLTQAAAQLQRAIAAEG